MVSIGAVTEGVMGAIGKGVELEHLSRRTGESVASLYQLQRGFENAGVEADALGPMLFKLQKSLGGVNEFGQETKSTFFRMGLDIGTLKHMDAPVQFRAVANALQTMNTSARAAAAGAIFGREGAQQFVQLANSLGEFDEGIRRSAKDAGELERIAPIAEKLEQGFKEGKAHVQAFFAGILEGVAPALQSIEDWFNNMDLSGFGQKIGKVLTAFVEAFKAGRLGELIGESLKFGFDSLLAIAPAMFERLGYFLLKALETPLEYIQAAMEYALEAGAHAFAKSKIFRHIVTAINPVAALGLAYIGDSGAPDFQKILADRKAEGVKFNIGTGEFGLPDIDKDAADRMKAALAKIGELSKPLEAMIDGLAGNAGKATPAAKAVAKATGGGDQDLLMKGQYKPEFTALEKMGFVMGGAGNPMLDLTRRTAMASERTNTLLTGMNALLGGSSGAPMTNQI